MDWIPPAMAVYRVRVQVTSDSAATATQEADYNVWYDKGNMTLEDVTIGGAAPVLVGRPLMVGAMVSNTAVRDYSNVDVVAYLGDPQSGGAIELGRTTDSAPEQRDRCIDDDQLLDPGGGRSNNLHRRQSRVRNNPR